MEEVYSGKWGTDFASVIKKIQPTETVGVTIGEVVSVTPLIIELIDGDILINSEVHDVFISTHLSETYTRDTNIEGNIQFSDSNCGQTSTDDLHSHQVQSLDVNTNVNISGSIDLTDGIKVRDKVMVVPDNTEQSFFIVSKLLKVGGG